MKRILAITLGVVVAAVLFGGLVHLVLVAAHVSEPAATTVQGMTPRRLWATIVLVIALAGVISGAVALRRSNSRIGIVAVVAGLIAVVNGALNLALATGGPGSGNGVIGGAMALVIGLISMSLGGLALARSRQSLSTD